MTNNYMKKCPTFLETKEVAKKTRGLLGRVDMGEECGQNTLK